MRFVFPFSRPDERRVRDRPRRWCDEIVERHRDVIKVRNHCGLEWKPGQEHGAGVSRKKRATLLTSTRRPPSSSRSSVS